MLPDSRCNRDPSQTRTTARPAPLGRLTAAFAALALGAALAPPSQARGQIAPAPDGAVTANGIASIERTPDVMRMQLALSADGKDAREALSKLKAQEQSVREKLTKLGATDASIQFGDPQATAGDRRQQMEMMIRQRTGRARPTTGPSQPAVTVSATVKAEWPLKSHGADDLLIEAQELQGKVKAANLSTAAAKPKTPEEEEEAEEAAALQNQNGEGNPNEPAYFFVTKISEEDRAKATADAFNKAKAEAQRLAKASGTELGNLRQLNSQAGPDMDRYGGMSEYGGQYQRAYYGIMQRMQQGDEAEAGEAVGLQPSKVAYRVMVSASFALK